MAKMRPSAGRQPFHAGRGVDIHVSLARTIHITPNKAFVACAHFKHGGWIRVRPGFEPTKMRDACAHGRNPRVAIAGATRKAAAQIAKRSGAFAGYSKTNRKSRRTRRASKRS